MESTTITPLTEATPIQIARTPVDSSRIASIGYDAATQKLYIEFKSFKAGGAANVYEYDDVPENVHAELMAAESHGTYFGANIKGAKGTPALYNYRKLATV